MSMSRRSHRRAPPFARNHSAPRQYHEKYRRSGASEPGSGEVAFLSWLESLNEAEWEDLLGDLLHDRPEAMDVVRPSRGDDALVQAAVLFDRVGEPTRALLRRAVDRLLGRLGSGRADDEPLLLRALLFVALVANSASSAVLIDAALDHRLSAEARFRAAAALAGQPPGAVPTVFWQQVDLDLFPELAPTVVAGLTPNAPQAALSRLLELADPFTEIDRLEYPLRMLLRRLGQTPAGIEHLRETLARAPSWLAEPIDEMLGFSEFSELATELRSPARHELREDVIFITREEYVHIRQEMREHPEVNVSNVLDLIFADLALPRSYGDWASGFSEQAAA